MNYIKFFCQRVININMIYLVPNANCLCLSNNFSMFKGAKYAVTNANDLPLLFLADNCFPLTLNLYEICFNLVHGGFSTDSCQTNLTNLKSKSASFVKPNTESENLNKAATSFEKENGGGVLINSNVKSANLKNENANLTDKNYFKYDYNKSYNDVLNMLDKHCSLTKFCNNVCCFEGDVFVFLNFLPICNFAFHSLEINKADVAISLAERLTISLGGKLLVDAQNRMLNYGHFEMFSDFCIVYFFGKRNFVAVLKNGELFYADYYDKVEILKDEIYFLTYLQDSINHGRVCHLSAKESEIYLVYLDEFELQLKTEFLPQVFLDCLLAGNAKYCNALLSDGLRPGNAHEIANFFCEFDRFYPLSNSTFALIKKDAVQGIYKFEIEKDKIANITEISC